ncbi:inorganic pyrophosphatase [Leptospira sp. GIMC2001]|uniref:inorganic pyrophosphatase n=1 Tax=Leptospira sp. GIMC2001 TaxID=1513297 RepID=UPI00234AEA4D|nr:inorganic pyrophosphatase [Leptospira sp. GIMC2001]WCL48182.1 inorganic pyrophosphatase [Leptospira sp. GIMC2001]
MSKNLHVSHPWHGIDPGPKAPEEMDVFIEMTPIDTMKYEVDKESGYIRVDRPQKYSNHSPSLYGFIPRTYCAEESAKRCMDRLGRTGIVGDMDPLDICVLSSNPINHGNIILTAIPIGGLRMIDKNEADDKIIAILKDDPVFAPIRDLKDLPQTLVNKLRHYFLTYKAIPVINENPPVEIPEVYDRAEALIVIGAAMRDYDNHFK